MDINEALSAFGSLSQETRLKTFKLLVEYGQDGCAATLLSEKLQVPQNTLSFHLSHLSSAGLVTSKREGRSIIYHANLTSMDELISYMMENCCASSDIDCLVSGRINKKKTG